MVDEAHEVALLLRVDEQGVDQLHDVELAVVGSKSPLLGHAVLHHSLVDNLGVEVGSEIAGGGKKNGSSVC